MKHIPQDIVGDIAILKFPRRTLWIMKKLRARKFLKQNKTIKTVLEKTEGFSGKLRIQKTKHLSGLKTKEAIYKENDCVFKFNVDETYFSPRLSNERKIIAEEVLDIVKKDLKPSKEVSKDLRITNAKRSQLGRAGKSFVKNSGSKANLSKAKIPKILVMFAGISPYPIVIARTLKQNKIPAIIISNELNKKANEAAKKNIYLNKLQDYITLVEGDANDLPKKLKSFYNSSDSSISEPKVRQSKGGTSLASLGGKSELQNLEKFDIILMPRPNLDDTFLKTALKLSKKGTTIFYHGFGTEEKVLNEIKKDIKNKITKIEIRKAGDIGPHAYRWQARFRVK